MNKPKKKTFISIFTVIVLAISSILYLLADRYLIEHVEVANVSAVAAQALPAQPASSQVKVAQASLNSQGSASSASATAPASGSGSVTLDDWNYQSDTTSISIKKVVTGSGSNQVTYYVAEVVLSDATQLLNAFAKNSFGRNIIEYTSQIAKNNDAIFAINGDYYGFRSDGIIIRNGVIYRNVPVRTGLAFY